MQVNINNGTIHRMTVQCNINNKVEVDMHIGKVAVSLLDFMMSILILFFVLFVYQTLNNMSIFQIPWSKNKNSFLARVQKWVTGMNFRMLIVIVELVVLVLIICAYDRARYLARNLGPLVHQENTVA